MRIGEFVVIALLLAILFTLSGCGRKGPLYLPQLPPPVVVTAPALPASAVSVPAASAPTPSPQ